MKNEQETHGNVLFLACSKLLPVDPALAWNTPSASQHLHRTNPSGDAATERKSERVSKNTLALTGQERASGGGHPGKGGGREEQQQEPAVRSHRGASLSQPQAGTRGSRRFVGRKVAASGGMEARERAGSRPTATATKAVETGRGMYRPPTCAPRRPRWWCLQAQAQVSLLQLN